VIYIIGYFAMHYHMRMTWFGIKTHILHYAFVYHFM